MHLGAIAQWISRLLAWVRPIINAMFLRYTRYFFGPSSYSLRITVGHRAPPNARLITFLWVVADFPVVFTVSLWFNLDILLKVVRALKLCCSLVWETFRFRIFAMSVEFGTKAVACYVKGYHHSLFFFFFTTTTSLFLTLNIQVSHHLQIARLIEAGGVKTAQNILQVVGVKKKGPYL